VISARASGRGRSLSLVDAELERSREFRGRLGICEGVRTRLGNDDHVGRRRDVAATSAEDLPEESLDAAADHRVPDPLAHRDPEAGARSGRPAPDDYQVLTVPPPPLVLHGQEVGASTQADGLGIGVRVGHEITRAASQES